MGKRSKKKRKLKRSVKLFLSLFLIIGMVLLSLYFIKPKVVTVKGNKYYSDKYIIEKLDLKNSKLFFTSSKLKNNLLKEDLIESITFKRRFPFILEVKINEKEILFFNRDKKVYVLSDASEVKLKENIKVTELTNYTIKKVYEEFIKEYAKINKNVRDKVSEITYKPNNYDDDLFLLYMNDHNYVYLNIKNMDKLNYYEDIMAKLGFKRGILKLDSFSSSNTSFEVLE